MRFKKKVSRSWRNLDEKGTQKNYRKRVPTTKGSELALENAQH